MHVLSIEATAHWGTFPLAASTRSLTTAANIDETSSSRKVVSLLAKQSSTFETGRPACRCFAAHLSSWHVSPPAASDQADIRHLVSPRPPQYEHHK